MPSYALISTNPSSPPPSAHRWGGGTESTEVVGRQEPPSTSNAVGGATEFSKKFEMALMVYSGAWGKISWHCPFKQ
jgi:hypothetical protein